MLKKLAFPFLLAMGSTMLARRIAPNYIFHNRVVIITGGSRGLGLVMAREFIAEGARVALLARDPDELARAEADLAARGGTVLSLPCDVTSQEAVRQAIRAVFERFGAIDVLVNNAGIIQVGPLDDMTRQDFEDAMAIHFYGPLHTVLETLPFMRAQGGGRIVNITSIGGKLAFPHLLPYTASKFALTGLSDGLRVELRRENILVTTVCPVLMRTGSPPHALFKGQHRLEYAWFAVSDSLPLLSISAERAARRILKACRRGAPRLIISAHAKAAVLLNELFPGASTALLSGINRCLPRPAGRRENIPGWASESAFAPSLFTRLSENAARQNNETRPLPEPEQPLRE